MNTTIIHTEPRLSPLIHNKAVISGNLAKDPFRVNLKNGNTLVNITIVQHQIINGRKQRHWFRINIQGEMANDAYEMLRKGDRAGFSGMLVSRNYLRDDNREFHIMELEAHEFWLERKCLRNCVDADFIEIID
ncbi:MAG: single-stranded DNA-binding protein [Bacteroidia bacterium]|jgi:single-stranded DNA-binding protein|nr:single-stranded DNA-binding protein [Bacteroidia bacterium]